MSGSTDIPVVDFSAFSLDKDAKQLNRDELHTVGSKLIDAFSQIGFVYLKNHGISEKLVSLVQVFYNPITKIVLCLSEAQFYACVVLIVSCYTLTVCNLFYWVVQCDVMFWTS